jgi:ribonuclease Z
VTELAPGFSVQGDGWELGSCSVPHAQPVLTCMAFSVESEGRKFVYSGDAAVCDDLKALTQDADTLLHWCYRLDGEEVHPLMEEVSPTPSEIAAMASGAGVKRLLLTHFRIHMDAPERHADALARLQSGFPGESGIVEDLDSYVI